MCGVYLHSRMCLYDVQRDLYLHTEVYVPYFIILKSCMISGVISDVQNNQIANHYVTTTLTPTLHKSSPLAATGVMDTYRVFHDFGA
jgi:hypothetical protein